MSALTTANGAGIEQVAFSRENTLAMIEERVAEIVWLCDFAKGQVSDTDRYFLGFAKGYAQQSAESAQWGLSDRRAKPATAEAPISNNAIAG